MDGWYTVLYIIGSPSLDKFTIYTRHEDTLKITPLGLLFVIRKNWDPITSLPISGTTKTLSTQHRDLVYVKYPPFYGFMIPHRESDTGKRSRIQQKGGWPTRRINTKWTILSFKAWKILTVRSFSILKLKKHLIILFERIQFLH